jgi:hypothetical protein
MIVKTKKQTHLKHSKWDGKKPDGTEIVIMPKEKFLGWYEFTRGQIEEIEKKSIEKNNDLLECPNCRTKMEDYIIKNRNKELWHLCPKCHLSFSQRQHRYFKAMINRLICSSKSNPRS